MNPGGVQKIGVIVTSPGVEVPMTVPPWNVSGGEPPLYVDDAAEVECGDGEPGVVT